jgi:Txe/YoeB family toxin of Txe-Axe toxin-antitoxin module
MSGYLMKEYCPRGLNLMYPLLGIKGGEAFLPDCYLYWNGEESIENFELIAYFGVDREGDTFRKFEKSVLLSNDKLKACYRVVGGMVYIFDLIQWSDEVAYLLEGKYSKFSDKAKRLVHEFWRDPFMGLKKPIDLTEPPTHYFHMIFNPHLYYDKVSQIDLDGITTPEELKEMGELWSKFNVQKETLQIEIEDDCNCIIPTEFTL